MMMMMMRSQNRKRKKKNSGGDKTSRMAEDEEEAGHSFLQFSLCVSDQDLLDSLPKIAIRSDTEEKKKKAIIMYTLFTPVCSYAVCIFCRYYKVLEPISIFRNCSVRHSRLFSGPYLNMHRLLRQRVKKVFESEKEGDTHIMLCPNYSSYVI